MKKNSTFKTVNTTKIFFAVLFAFLLVGVGSVSGQTVLVSPIGDGGFEIGSSFAANGWTVVNGSSNYWVIGSATQYAGTKSVYISNDGTNNLYTIGTSNTSHFYKDITVPPGESAITLSFYLQGTGETNWDRLLVYTAPTTVNPVAGTPASNSTTLSGATLVYTQTAPISTFALQTITLPASLTGTTFRLIFTWQNDNNTGSNPPTAIDNISVTSVKQTQITSSQNYNVPSGTTKVKVECWGAGGGGSSATTNYVYGGGGGGGAYASSIVTVTSGGSYAVVVGTGGIANTAGGNSSFGSTTVVAVGGSGAISNSSTSGSGGLSTASTGDVKYSGGDGADGNSTSQYSGGGGGGAGSSGAGSAASGTTAGIGAFLFGGDGGTGLTTSSDGNSGSNYGGGGSGARKRTGGTNYTGGSGAPGIVLITPLKKYYRSSASGNWSDVTTWDQSYDNVTWQSATTIPSNADLLTTVRSGHTVTLTAAATVRDLIIDGTLSLGTNTLTGMFSLTVSSTGKMNVGGASNFPTGFSTISLNTGSTVDYNLSGNQTVSNQLYSNLTLSAGGIKTLLVGMTNIGGNLTIDDVTTTAVAALSIGGDVILNKAFNFNGGNFTHKVAGNWTRNGWNNYASGSSGTINFTGNNSAINGTQNTQTFNNITISKSAGQTLSVGGGSMTNLNVTGNLTLSSGAFAPGTTATLVSGNWTNGGGSLTSGTGIITFNGSGKTIGGTSSTTFNNLTINNNVGGILLGVDQYVNGTLTLSNGVLNIGAFNLTMGALSPAIVGGPWSWNGNMIIAVGNGELRKVFTSSATSYVFPIGDATTVSPMTLNFTQATYDVGAYAGVNVTKSKQPQNLSPNYLNRYWSVSQSGISAFLCNVTGTYLWADLVGAEGAQNSVQFPGYYPWLNYSTLSGNTVTANGVSTFGDFTGMGLPTLNTSGTTTLDGFTYIHYYGPSDPPKSFTVTATNLSSNVVVTAPADFEVSTTYTGGYGSSVTITPNSAGAVNSTIYVHLKAGLAVGNYSNETIVCSTTGLSLANILLTNATVTAPTPCLPTGDGTAYSITRVIFNTIDNATAKLAGYTDYTSTQSTNLLVGGTYQLTVNVNTNGANTVGAKVWIDWNNGGFTYNSGYATYDLGTVTNTSNGKTSLCPLSITVPAGASLGAARMRVACLNGSSPYNACDNNSEVEDYTLNIVNPVINVSATTLSGFKYANGNGPSNEMSFTVTGTGLADNIVVTPPTNYEISTLSGGIFQSTALTITKTGTNVNATIYARLKKDLPTGSYGPDPQNITLTSTSATTKNVNCSGTVVPGITAGGGGSYCAASPISLSATATDYNNLYWEGPIDFYSLNNLTPSIDPPLTNLRVGKYKVTASYIIGPNLVVNGDFETAGAQPVSFTSDYTYKDPSCTTCGAWGPLSSDFAYSVSYMPSDVHTLLGSYPDHSTTGKQMIVNGATVLNQKIWSQAVPVAANSNYQFTYWVQSANATDPAPSQLQLLVNGVSAGPTYTALAAGGIWKQFLYNWKSGSSTTATLSLVNKQTLGSGNDFGLDDIVFQQICTSSDSVFVSVIITPIPAVVTITPSATPVSLGTSVTFTATPTNGGTGPTYQWSVAGTPIVGATGTTYTYVPANNDVVKCTMSSNSGCLTGSTSVSSSLTMSVTARTNYWKGTNGTDWGTASNWTDNIVPGDGSDVAFSTSSTAYGDASKNLILDVDRTIGKLINQSSKQLIIPPAKCLTVNGAITTDAVSSRILIQAYPDGSQQNGSMIFYTTSPVYGTVEMYSKASISALASPNKYNWQYFGIPVTQITASPTFDGSYIRKWDETKSAVDHWIQLGNSSTLDPFYGYEICQPTPQKITFAGQLVNTNKSFGPLAITTGAAFPGQYIFANPYTAAIDITKLTFGADTQATVYLYNTGAIGLWTSIGGSNSNGSGAGQYLSIPKLNAGQPGIPDQIPSMQAILIRPKASISTDFTFSINYNAVATKNTSLQRVSAANNTSSNTISTLIDVKSGKFSDRMWIFTNSACTRGFDNGWDGQKILGSALTPQLFAMEADGNYQVNSVPDVHDTELGFQAGEDVQDTLIFTHYNTEKRYAGLYLQDLVENKTVDITVSGTNYVFTAASTPEPVKRFRIVTRPYEKDAADAESQVKIFSSRESIFVQNFSSLNGECVIYDIAGHYIKKVPFGANGVTTITNSLKQGAYVAVATTSTDKVSKRLIVR